MSTPFDQAGPPRPDDGPPPALAGTGSVPAAPDGEDPAVDGGSEDAAARGGTPPRGAQRRQRRQRRRRLVLAGLGVVVLLLVGVVAWYEIEANPSGPTGPKVVLEVRAGETTDDVINSLERDGVIGSALAFHLSLLVHGTPTIVPGGYLLHENQPFSAVRSILSGGPDVSEVTVPPGYTLAELARDLGGLTGPTSTGFLQAAEHGTVRSPFEPAGSTNLEGLIGTGTYQILPGETNNQLLTQMVDRFDRQAAAAGLTPAAAQALGYSPYAVVTVASIVQKEGYIEKNMGPVARVIYNRLAAGMKLQMDSTVLYALGHDGGPVTEADLQLNSPYNTYVSSGLTPTPVCAPSLAALRAALDPPAGGWLYFVVVKKDGTEAFSDTYAGQLANERLASSRGLG